jgi:hypothetical protein
VAAYIRCSGLQSSALCSILSPTETALFNGFGSDPEGGRAGLPYKPCAPSSAIPTAVTTAA